jgi:hypothetical protein
MSNKVRLKNVEIEGYYFINHPGLYWHSGSFWHNEDEIKIVYNNGSNAVKFCGKKLGIKKLRKQAIKCKINIEKYSLPF